MTQTAAFPLWINDVPAITELQRLHRTTSRSYDAQDQTATTATASSVLRLRDVFRCNSGDPKECWQYVLLSSYLTDLKWLLTSVPELSAVTGKVVILSGDRGTATLRRSESGAYLPTSAALNRVNPFLAALRNVAQLPRRTAGAASSTSSAPAPVPVQTLTRDRFAALEPPLPIAFGTHHTKMAVCVNACGVRVCVFTGNLLEQDWCWKTQGIYLQDFPWADNVTPLSASSSSAHSSDEPRQANAKARDFEWQLRHYWTHCGLDMSTPFTWDAANTQPLGIFNTDFLSHVDFARAKVWLVSSVPGTYVGGEASAGYRVGLCRLAEVLQRRATATACERSAPEVLTWQYSSQGSLNPGFLTALQAAMCGTLELATATGAKNDLSSSCPSPSSAAAAVQEVQEVQVIYPTETEVRSSFEGWRGGASLPVRLLNCHEFVNERLHRWGGTQRPGRAKALTADLLRDRGGTTAGTHDSPEPVVDVDGSQPDECSSWQGDDDAPCSAAACRQYTIPHIKSYAAMDVDRTHLHWYLLTSANLSQAAWGSLSSKTTKTTPRRLLVRSYELGVLYDDTSTVDVSGDAASWFSVVTSSSIPLPTSANSQDLLIATPLMSQNAVDNYSNRNTACTHRSSESDDANNGPGTVASAAPLLFLPCEMLRPTPYVSTAALRERRRAGPSEVMPPVAVSCRDVPWVMDTPHHGLDAYGRDVEEAFASDTLPPFSRWRPRPEVKAEAGVRAGLVGRKRVRE